LCTPHIFFWYRAVKICEAFTKLFLPFFVPQPQNHGILADILSIKFCAPFTFFSWCHFVNQILCTPHIFFWYRVVKICEAFTNLFLPFFVPQPQNHGILADILSVKFCAPFTFFSWCHFVNQILCTPHIFFWYRVVKICEAFTNLFLPFFVTQPQNHGILADILSVKFCAPFTFFSS
jgi:hypothetical protein